MSSDPVFGPPVARSSNWRHPWATEDYTTEDHAPDPDRPGIECEPDPAAVPVKPVPPLRYDPEGREYDDG